MVLFDITYIVRIVESNRDFYETLLFICSTEGVTVNYYIISNFQQALYLSAFYRHCVYKDDMRVCHSNDCPVNPSTILNNITYYFSELTNLKKVVNNILLITINKMLDFIMLPILSEAVQFLFRKSFLCKSLKISYYIVHVIIQLECSTSS